jgi:hypothetical protein
MGEYDIPHSVADAEAWPARLIGPKGSASHAGRLVVPRGGPRPQLVNVAPLSHTSTGDRRWRVTYRAFGQQPLPAKTREVALSRLGSSTGGLRRPYRIVATRPQRPPATG